MPQLQDADQVVRPIHDRRPTTRGFRTYRQIADILSERQNMPINPASVKQMCRIAETKLARALLADPVLREWMGPRILEPPFHEIG